MPNEELQDTSAIKTVTFQEGVSKSAVISAAEALAGPLSSAQEDEIWNTIVQMSPNSVQQDVYLTISEAPSVIFHWVDRGKVSTYQVIRHYPTLEKDAAGNYTTYVTHTQELVGNRGDSVQADTNTTRIGFEYDSSHAQNDIQGSIPGSAFDNAGNPIEGLVLNVYYKRKSYSYTVHHYKYGTTDKVAEDTQDTAEFETEILRSALRDKVTGNLTGYKLHEPDSTVMVVEDNQSFTCYYIEKTVTYKYQFDETDGEIGGTFTNWNDRTIVGTAPEGDILTVSEGYFLQKWFYKIDGEEDVYDVPETWLAVSDNQITVTPTAPEDNWADKTILIYATIQPTALTVKTTLTTPASAPSQVTEGQGFVYRITSTVDPAFMLRVAVTDGQATVYGLPIGEYTVTPEDDWAWRYEGSSQSVTVNGETEIIFELTPPDEDYTGGYYVTDEALKTHVAAN